MDASSPKPRVNGSMISSFIGKYVCLVGKNLGLAPDGLSMSVESSDGQKIDARFLRPSHDPLDPYVELVAKVEHDCTLTVVRIVNFGTEFDLTAYDDVLRLTSRFPDLFNPSSGATGSRDGKDNMDF